MFAYNNCNIGGDMQTVTGDLVKMALQGEFDVIVHECSCDCDMQIGLGKQIRQFFPEAYMADMATVCGDMGKLGNYSKATSRVKNGELIIINAYTRQNNDNDMCGAIKSVFQKIKSEFSGLRIGYPQIGTRLKTRSWDQISPIIDEALADEDHVLVLWDILRK